MPLKNIRPLFIFCIALCSLLPLFSQGRQFKALLVTTTRGFHHESIYAGVLAIQQMASKHQFSVEVMNNPNGFTDKYLESFQVIIFLNTTGDILDSARQKVMERFIQSGKGFVGIHAAADTEYDWEWYTKLVGRMFVSHPPTQTAKLKATDPSFPGLRAIGDGIWWTDEWYEYTPEKGSGLQYLLEVDESSYNAKAGSKTGGMGSFHPIAWYHNFDGGRSFYTGLGHLPEIFQNPVFLDHLYAGIFWAATGRK